MNVLELPAVMRAVVVRRADTVGDFALAAAFAACGAPRRPFAADTATAFFVLLPAALAADPGPDLGPAFVAVFTSFGASSGVAGRPARMRACEPGFIPADGFRSSVFWPLNVGPVDTCARLRAVRAVPSDPFATGAMGALADTFAAPTARPATLTRTFSTGDAAIATAALATGAARSGLVRAGRVAAAPFGASGTTGASRRGGRWYGAATTALGVVIQTPIAGRTRTAAGAL